MNGCRCCYLWSYSGTTERNFVEAMAARPAKHTKRAEMTGRVPHLHGLHDELAHVGAGALVIVDRISHVVILASEQVEHGKQLRTTGTQAAPPSENTQKNDEGRG